MLALLQSELLSGLISDAGGLYSTKAHGSYIEDDAASLPLCLSTDEGHHLTTDLRTDSDFPSVKRQSHWPL